MSNQQVTVQPTQEDIDQNRIIALLSYIGILFLIPMFARKDSVFCKYHVNQGIVLFLCNVVISILSYFISIVGILSIVTLIFMILGIVNCVQGKVAPLPLIGSIQIWK